MDIKKVVTDFEAQVKKLTTEVNSLEKKKTNYDNDIVILKGEHTSLRGKVNKLVAHVADVVAKATEAANAEIANLKSDLLVQKETLATERSKTGNLNQSLEDRIKENDKLKKNLQENIKQTDLRATELNDLKTKLQGMAKTIKEAL